MNKLYKTIDQSMFYWETWENQGVHTIHWGEVGTPGQSRELKSNFFSKPQDKVQKEAELMVADGYAPIDIDDHDILMIEYSIDGMGTPDDLQKRHDLQDGMDELLGWVGLGHCDGGSIGSGTMEVCCFVVDFDIAKGLLEQELPRSPFADFTRIYKE